MKFIIEISDAIIEKTEVGLEFPVSAAERVLTGWLNQHEHWFSNEIKVLGEVGSDIPYSTIKHPNQMKYEIHYKNGKYNKWIEELGYYVTGWIPRYKMAILMQQEAIAYAFIEAKKIMDEAKNHSSNTKGDR